ncbi:MAG: DUF362 domain-containing protein [Halanaerobiales bacterium]
MEKVCVVKCHEYKEEFMYQALKEVLKEYNGIDSIIKPGQRVLLKVNLLMGKPPEAMVTTNPVFVKAICRLVKDAGAKPVIADSPGGPFEKNLLRRAYRKSGLMAAAEESGAELNYNTGQKSISFEEGIYNRSFVFGEFAADADAIINLPKLKTHGLTMISAAVKNLFGVIPGLLKAEYHLRMQELEHFTKMLVELALCVKPQINIMDAIIGMEGEGPSAGRPKKFGYILASKSAAALDVAAANLMGITPVSKVPTIKAAGELGLAKSMNDILLAGDELQVFNDTLIPSIEKKSNLLDRRLPGFLAKMLDPLLRPKPVFHHEKCVGCRDCYQSCPAGVIEMSNNRPEVELEGCIRCFCCQELCQFQAVEIKRPLLSRLFLN